MKKFILAAAALATTLAFGQQRPLTTNGGVPERRERTDRFCLKISTSPKSLPRLTASVFPSALFTRAAPVLMGTLKARGISRRSAGRRL